MESVDTKSLEIVGRVLETSAKEAERLNNEIKEWRYQQGYEAGYEKGLAEGKKEIQRKFRKLLGISEFLADEF